MAFAYVKSGGTATGTAGKYETAKTGSWSTAFSGTSEYYNDLNTCLTDAVLSEGDLIYISDLHDYTYTPSGSLYISTSLNDLKLISVDDDDVTVLSPGAKETIGATVSAAGTITLPYIYGLILEGNSNTYLRLAYNSLFNSSYPRYATYEKCSFKSYRSSTATYVDGNGRFIECIFDLSVNSTFYLYSGTSFRIFQNCTFISTESSDPAAALFGVGVISTVMHLYADGCDFSQANRALLNTTTSNYLYNTTQKWSISRSIESANNRSSVYHCASEDPAAFYLSGSNKNLIKQYYPAGSVEAVTSVYRDSGATYDNSNYFSLEIVMNNLSAIDACPLVFKLSDIYLDTANFKTFTVEIAQPNGSTSFTDYDLFLEVYHQKNNSIKSCRKSTVKMMPSSTNLPTSAETWTGLTSPVVQYLSVTTSEIGDFGLNSVYLGIRAYNKTFYICPKVDIS